MTEENYRSIAEQLRRPHGTFAKEVAEKMNEGNLLMNEFTIEELCITASDNILEIGMGNGFFVKYILDAASGVKYAGCDFSEIMVNEARIKNEQYISNSQANFMLANANNLPYKNEHFEKVFTVNTIYFWDDVTIVLSEIKRVLKKNGLLIIAIRPESIMNNLPFTKFGFNTFSAADLTDILAKNEFKVSMVIEKADEELEFFGEKFKNEFLVVKAIKL